MLQVVYNEFIYHSMRFATMRQLYIVCKHCQTNDYGISLVRPMNIDNRPTKDIIDVYVIWACLIC